MTNAAAVVAATPTNTAPLLAMRGMGKRFAGVHALRNVSFEVHEGETVALLGENGAGKSTLMKILGGVYRPDDGEMTVAGTAYAPRSVRDAAQARIGFIHQELNVLDNLDIAGNVFLGREPTWGGPLRLVDRARMIRETQGYLDRLGLAFPADMPLAHLSLAQRQLVEIAKALSLDARLLIMDEPTSSLTLTETDRLLGLIGDLKTRGVSIVYISHRLNEIAQIADRVVGLRDGANAGELARHEITHERMVRLMVGRDLDRANVGASASIAASEGHRARLVVSDLRTRRYPETAVSFKLREGEILGMAGLIGAGRSEVAQALFGVEPALAGTLTLDGQTLPLPRSAKEAIKSGIFLAPEDRRHSGLIVEMSLRENVTLPALARFANNAGLIRRDRETESAQTACDAIGVKAPSVEFVARNLSGGNQQKVVLAKWLSLGPKVMIFDEPTRGVDVGAKAEIYVRMRNLAREGVAILMISSDMEEALALSDRLAVMHEGHITGILARADATEESVMRLAVGGGSGATTNAGEAGAL